MDASLKLGGLSDSQVSSQPKHTHKIPDLRCAILFCGRASCTGKTPFNQSKNLLTNELDDLSVSSGLSLFLSLSLFFLCRG